MSLKDEIHYFIHISDTDKMFMINNPDHVRRMQADPYYREVTKYVWNKEVNKNGSKRDNSTKRND